MGVIPYEYLMFSGRSSEDFKAHISGSGTFISPTRDVESISVPGRNGDLHVDNGRFTNVSIIYPAFITEDFEKNYSAFKAFLCAQIGYKILADSYHPDHYRRAMFNGGISQEMATLNRAGSFELSFDCDPRLFLKSGDKVIRINAAGEIYNRTQFASKPVIRAYGTGTLTIGDVSIEIISADEYTDIDCELQEAYKGDVNCNSNIELENGVFPELMPGLNEITYSGILDIIPKWWTV
ncbi:MAG: hypothetical protein IJR31_08660 [Lachnospiraceae bacterium]|nr:hypothetical protein [Lachnospiraceae bacterium]